MTAHTTQRRPDAAKVLNALAQPLLTVDVHGMVVEVNAAAETFFDMGRGALLRSRLTDLIPSDSPIFALVADALSNRSTVNGYKIDISTPRIGNRNDVDVFVAPLSQTDDAVAVPHRRNLGVGHHDGDVGVVHRQRRTALDAGRRVA